MNYARDLNRSLATGGFTLIELVVVMAIVGILSVIAFPSYKNYINRTSRSEAKGILWENAQFLERNYTMSNCFHRTDSDCTNATPNLALPFTQSPKAPTTAKYLITVEYPTDDTGCALVGDCYTLVATPTGSMALDECGSFTMNNTGAQANRGVAGKPDDVPDQETLEKCWNR